MYQKLLIVTAILCIGLFLVNGNVQAEAEVAPEIAILERYQQVKGNDKAIEQLFQDATFLHDPQAASTLLDHLHEVDQLKDIRLVHKVLERITCNPEEIVIARLRTETEPWQKYKLLRVIVSFYQKNVFEAFYEQIDDTGMGERPGMYGPHADHRTPLRVRDYVYLVLTGNLKGLGYLPSDTPFKHFYQQPYEGRSEEAFAERDRLIEEFKTYWEANQEQIFKELPVRIEALSPNTKKRIRYSQPDEE